MHKVTVHDKGQCVHVILKSGLLCWMTLLETSIAKLCQEGKLKQ